jgi:outer membrane receptor protein involved in Fe transport
LGSRHHHEFLSIARLSAVVAIVLSLLAGSISPAFAQAAAGSSGRITGVVVDQGNSLPISGASIGVYQGDRLITTVKADKNGAFKIDNIPPGFYSIFVQAGGFANSRSREFTVAQGQEVAVNLAVNRAESDQSSNIKTIASVSASAASAIASTTTISRTLDVSVVQKENNIRLADALVKLPGVNGGGLSSSVGDDTSINIRGLGASETVALLDGHPVGPQGVYGINGGGTYPTSFNYADTPIFGLNKVTVTFGSGATGLYGVDAIGGTVDLQTINFSATPQFNATVGAGSQGRSQTAASFTGSLGRISYAFAGGVQGTYGEFYPQQIAQTGRPNNNPNLNNNGNCTDGTDVSTCNLNLNTYSVSQNALLKAGVAKLRYNLSNNTNFTATVYSSGDVADSTGNGDNDYIPYDTRLAQIQANQTPGCALPHDTGGAVTGYTVITNGNTGSTACYSAQQWAAASSGPYGGGEDRNRGTNMTDYHFRLQSSGGKNTITADGFYNY